MIFGTLVWNDDISRHFFFLILIFWAAMGVKLKKVAQNDKKLCLLHFISQEPCIIWLSCMMHMCKMMTSLGASSFCQNFDFLGWLGDKRAKIGPKWQKKILSVSQHISGTIPHMIGFLVHLCKMIMSPAVFFIFSKKVLEWWVKGQKMTHNYQFQSVLFYISRTEDHIIKIFGTQV